MSKPMSKTTEKVVPKKVYKISIKYHSDGKSMILRKDLSALIDTTDKSLAWLKAHDFKAEDIEIIGDKPYGWDLYYPAPVVEPDPVLVEKLAEVLAAPPTDTIAVTTVNLDSGTVIQEQVGDVFEGLPVAPVADPILDPIMQSLGIPKADVTTLTDVFVPVKDSDVPPPMSIEEAIKNASEFSDVSPD